MLLLISLIYRGRKLLGLQMKMNGEDAEEINLIGKPFLPLKARGICGSAPHVIDLKR